MTLVPAREEVALLADYRAGAQVDGTVRLNANEAPAADPGGRLNRYPEVRPASVSAKMSALLEVPKANLLVTRGSSEAIDVLIRAWCRAYRDDIITTPPTFEMYRVYADIQGIEIKTVPLVGERFDIDKKGILAAATDQTKLIFLCSPNNPTGSTVDESDVLEIADKRAGRSIVVVDEAYIEFSGRESMAKHIRQHDNLVVLRTLSKAHALAGARCGAAIAAEPVIDVMTKVLPPYSFSTPATDTIVDAMSPGRLASAAENVRRIVIERDRLAVELEQLACVTRVFPSHANFLLVEMQDAASVVEYLAAERLLVRYFGANDGLGNCVRITIGTQDENELLLDALGRLGGLSS